jgi:hypothetical protein
MGQLGYGRQSPRWHSELGGDFMGLKRLVAALGVTLLALSGLMLAGAPAATSAPTGQQYLVICGGTCTNIPLGLGASAPDLAAAVTNLFVENCGSVSPGAVEAIPFIVTLVFCQSGVAGFDAFPLQVQDSLGTLFQIFGGVDGTTGGNGEAGLDFPAAGAYGIFLCTQEAGNPCP